MILSRHAIINAFQSGAWKSSAPLESLNIGPNSIDVTLSPHILVPREELFDQVIDPFDSENSEGLVEKLFEPRLICEKYGHHVFHANNPFNTQFLLGSVNEKFDCSAPLNIGGVDRYFAPMYEGRSTVARLGVQSHVSAAFGDYGFDGSFTLEIVNNSPWTITLRRNIRIGQVYFIEVDDGVLQSPKYSGYDQSDCQPAVPRLGPGRF